MQYLQRNTITNARNTFRSLVGAEQLELDELPPRVVATNIGLVVDVFSDGGFSNPTLPQFGLSTFGTWHANRTFSQDYSHMTELEHMYTNSIPKGGGLGLTGAIGGFAGSSTRAELSGAIVTTFSPHDAHVGIDNKAIAHGAQ